MTVLDDLKLGTSLGLVRLTMWRLRRRGDLFARLNGATTLEDPYPLYEEVRGLGRLQHGSLGVAVTASHAVSSRLLRDPRFAHQPEQGGGVPARRFPEPTLPAGMVHPIDDSFLLMDPPEHTRLRRLVSPAFTPRALAQLRPRIEGIAHELLDRLDQQPSLDLIDSFAAPLPIQVVCELLGVPRPERARFARWGSAVGATLAGVESVRQARQLRRTLLELNQFFNELIASRRRGRQDDLVSQLLAADEPLSHRDLMATCLLLFVAGFETTVNLIGNGVLALLRHPDQLERFHADPDLAPNLVEEVLRYDPPVQRTARLARQDVELDGARVDAGEIVMFLLAGANRDPEVFERPASFDIGRPNAREHLAFAAGIHYCLGAGLARTEGDVAFRALRERLPRLQLAGPVRRRPSQIIRGALHLPLRQRRAPIGV